MSQQNVSPRECFRFQSQALTGDNPMHVVRFSGEEGLSRLYSFEIVLATQAKSLPIERMLAEPARLTLLRDGGNNACFSGLPTSIEQTHRYNDWTFYTLVLQPAFWRFTQIVQNSIHIDKDVRETVKKLLESIDYFDVSHEFRLTGKYPKQEFSMQHNESIYDYIVWKLEREGIYYYFDEKDEGEHVVFADNPLAHALLPHTPELTYSPTSGLEYIHREEVLSRFSLQVSSLPRQVVLRDYDWMKPQSPVVATAEVAKTGLGNVYYYGEGFTTKEEGERLAKIRAAALTCTGRVFTAESNVSTIRPGFVFKLKGHYDDDFNRDYTITTVKHEGSQEAWLSLAIGVPIVRNDDRLFYRNAFTCIPADVQFRPERKTTRARVSGMMTAFVDAATTSGLPEIDEHGRYKVYFPQDNTGSVAGKASCWIRRMQPHVGKGQGTFFPLAPGAEVMISFLDGDPDRPFIAGAVANGETGAIENTNTSLTTGFATDNGNSLIFNNNSRKQGLSLRSGGGSGIYMSSGSLDSMHTFSNNVSDYATAAQTSIAGLASTFQSSFRSSLLAAKPASGTSFTWQLILKQLSSLGTNVFGATKNSKAQTVWDSVNTALKVVNSILAYNNPTPPTTYGVTLSSDAEIGLSSVGAAIYPGPGRLKAFAGFTALELAAMITKTVDSTKKDFEDADKALKDHKKKQKLAFAKIQREKTLVGKSPEDVAKADFDFITGKLSSDEIDALLKKYRDDNTDISIQAAYATAHGEEVWKKLTEEQRQEKLKDSRVDAMAKAGLTDDAWNKLTPAEKEKRRLAAAKKLCGKEKWTNLSDPDKQKVYLEEYFKLFPAAKAAALAKAYDKAATDVTDDELKNNALAIRQKIAADDPTYFENLQLPSDADVKWGKAQAITKHVGSAVATLLAEILVAVTLLKKRYDGVTDEDFGGIRIRSNDRNVAIGSNTETRVTGGKVVTIRALGSENWDIGKRRHTELLDNLENNGLCDFKNNGTHLLLTSETTYSGSFKNASVLAGGNLTLGANKNITLSTKESTLDLLQKDITLAKDRAGAFNLDTGNIKAGISINTGAMDNYLADISDKKFSTLNITQQKVTLDCQDNSTKASENQTSCETTPTSQTLTLKKGKDTLGSITHNHTKLEATSKDMSLTLDGGASTFTVKKDENLTFTMSADDKAGQTATLTAAKGITFKANDDAGTGVKIESGAGVTVASDAVTLGTGKGTVNIKGTTINLADKMKIDEQSINANASGQLKLNGGIIKIG